MKDRAKVICHMITSINGNAVTPLLADTNLSAASEVYTEQVLSFGKAWGCGRNTFQKVASAPVDLSQYRGKSVSYEDKVIAGEDGRYCVAFDRYGKLLWNTDIGPYWGGKILEVLTEQVTPEFVAYLDDMKISYMFAGKEDFEPEVFLKKLKEKYQIDTFVLAGGPSINGIFMEKNLIDEINLVITPGVDGILHGTFFAGAEELSAFPKYFRVKEVKQFGNDVINLQYERQS